jgi:glycosyltransferase involved in cell wall biosynthesis
VEKYSLVIPAYNESAYLPLLLDSIDVARKNYHGDSGTIEVIVADNNSSDDTATIAHDRGCKVAHVTERRIASVRNGGASIAEGEVLCFVDADMRIHPETFNAIEKSIQSKSVVAGSTGIRFERLSLGIVVTHAMMLPIIWKTKIDSGVVFCRKDDFEEIGGYNESMNFGEDVRFLLEVRELGRTRGQKLVRLTGAKALASTRKFDQHGEWHFLVMMVEILRGGGRNVDQNSAFVDRYWYGKQREP